MKFNEQPATYNGRAEVRLVRNLPAPIERVWAYFTEPEKRAKWFAGGKMEPKVGGKATFKFRMKDLAPNEKPPADAETIHETGAEMESTITKWDPPYVLGFTFGSTGDSDVTIELSRHGMDTQVVITHRTRGEDLDYGYEFAGGWHRHMALLEAELKGVPRPPFWSEKQKLEDFYKAAMPAS